MPLDTPWEPLVGAFSSTFAPRPDKALVLGLGSGATASTVGLLFDKTTGVEINAAVLQNLHRMKEYNFDIENNPKVTIIHDDGIHFAKTSNEKFSLIINTVTTPLYFSSGSIRSLITSRKSFVYNFAELKYRGVVTVLMMRENFSFEVFEK